MAILVFKREKSEVVKREGYLNKEEKRINIIEHFQSFMFLLFIKCRQEAINFFTQQFQQI